MTDGPNIPKQVTVKHQFSFTIDQNLGWPLIWLSLGVAISMVILAARYSGFQ